MTNSDISKDQTIGYGHVELNEEYSGKTVSKLEISPISLEHSPIEISEESSSQESLGYEGDEEYESNEEIVSMEKIDTQLDKLETIEVNSPSNTLRILYTNADTILNKIEELETLIKRLSPQIISIVELFPKSKSFKYNYNDFVLAGFNLFVNENGKRGTALYVSDRLVSASHKYTDSGFEESVWCKIELGQVNLLIGTIYRSPNSDESNNNKLNLLLDEINRSNFKHVLIIGDFNYKDIDWETRTTKLGTESATSKFLDRINLNDWYQHVQQSTRYREGQKSSLLDLIITNEEHAIDNLEMYHPLGKSDHVVLKIDYVIPVVYKNNIEKYRFYKGDFIGLNNHLNNANWEKNKKLENVHDMWDELLCNVNQAVSKFIPRSKKGMRKGPEWLDKTVLEAVKYKHKMWNKFQKQRTSENWSTYVQVRNRATKIVKLAKRNSERRVVMEIKSNPKNFWNMVNRKTKMKPGITDLETKEGNKITDDKQKAEELNNFFVSVFTKENIQNVPILEQRDFESPLETVRISEQQMGFLLKKLKIDKSPGPDNIHNRILFEGRNELQGYLTNICNKSLEQGELPAMWKTAEVVPIFKKGKKSDPNNYRPVSLTSSVCKLVETVIRDAIFKHLESNELLTDAQYGFRKGRSCCTQLLDAMKDWVNAIDEGYPTDIIYLDYRKAFDSVPHERLLNKLEAYGIKGEIHRWIRNFLIGRTQRVIVNGEYSEAASVSSGIPQGSVLGPILFLIFINDLPEILQSIVKLFADDTKLYRTIVDKNDETILQNDIDQIAAWSERWQIPFNVNKCKVLKVGKNDQNVKYSMGTLEGRIELEQVQYEKDLGVIFDTDLKFSQHIQENITKANQRIGLIRRNFKYLNRTSFLMLYKSLVRPILEYCSPVWTVLYIKHSEALERVQRHATKLLHGIKDLSYPQRLKILDLPTLIYRRRRADMLQIYRIIKGIDQLKQEEHFILAGSTSTRGHSYKIVKGRSNTTIKQHILGVRAINDWNALTEETVQSDNINIFKNNLEKLWKDLPFKHDPTGYHG